MCSTAGLEYGSCKAEQGTEAQLDRESHSLRAPETGTLSSVPREPLACAGCFDVTDMLTSYVVNFHEFLVEAAVHELTIHSKCSSDTVQAKRHQNEDSP